MKYGWEWKSNNLTFFGISLAGIHTSILVKELSVCLDVAQGLPHCQRAKTICLTHGHMDHAAGLPYVLSMMAMHKKTPLVLMPESLIQPMTNIMHQWQEIDQFQYDLKFKPAPLTESILIKRDFSIRAIPSFHRIDSCGYALMRKKKKLKAKYKSTSQSDIINLKKQGIDVDDHSEQPIVVFSGDTKSEFLDNQIVRNSKLLFIECTYIDQRKTVENARSWGHIHIDEIVERIDELKNEKIIIKHVSSRYKTSEIEKIFKQRMSKENAARIVIFKGR